MNNRTLYVLVIALFAGSYLLGHYLSQPVNPISKKMLDYQNCDPSRTTCVAVSNGQGIELKFLQPPSSLEAFDVIVKTQGLSVESVSLDFYMKDMDMGVNKYSLMPKGKNVWMTQAMLPICSLARNDWIVELQIIHEKKIWFAEYSFEQK